MATKYASATGSWSTMVWWTTSAGTTTTTAPGVGDDADLNGKTVTLDQNVTLDNIIGAGTLVVTASRTINANCGNAASAWVCSLSAGGIIVSVVGNVVAGITSNRFGITASTAVLNITGKVTGGVGTTIRGVNLAGGTVNVTGDIEGGTASGAHGIQINGAGATLNHTGSLIDSATTSAVVKTIGTYNYTPTNAQTATIGGKVLYPTTGGMIRGGGLSGGLQ